MRTIIKIVIAAIIAMGITACGPSNEGNVGSNTSKKEYRDGSVFLDKLESVMYVTLDTFADTEGFKDSSAKIFITDERGKAITSNFQLEEGENYFLKVEGKNPIKTSFVYNGEEFLTFALKNFYGKHKPEGRKTKVDSEITVKVFQTPIVSLQSGNLLKT